MELAPAIAKSPIRLVLRPLLWFCAASLLAPVSPAQCSNVAQVPDQTISSGASCFSNNGTLTAAGVTINAGAQVSFIAGGTVHPAPGFRATAGTAGTTFHAWAEALPSVVPVTPSSGSGGGQPFTWRVSSPYGHANILQILALINTSISGVNGCFIYYNRSANLLHLANDASTGWSAGFAPGSAGSAGNSYCTINGIGSSVSGSGNELALTVSIAFQSAFAGTKNNYLQAYNNEGLYTDWQNMGTWTVPAPQMYFLTTTASPAGSGTISPACPGSCQFGSGSQITITATPAGGYLFTGFSGSLTGGSPGSVTMNSNKSVTANFTQTAVTQTITSVPAGLSLTVDGGACTAPCVRQWQAGTIHTISAATQSGGSGTQYLFGSWSDSGTATHTITAPSSSATFTATFAAQYFLTTSASGGGSISPAPPGAWYHAGAQVQVAATPNSGYQFSGFSGALSGTTTPQPLTLSGPLTVAANFTSITTLDFTITVSPPQNMPSEQLVTAIPVTITPLNGFSSPVNFTWMNTSSWPADLTASFTQNPAVGSTSVSAASSDRTPAGHYTLQFSAAGAGNTHNAEIEVPVPDIDLWYSYGLVALDTGDVYGYFETWVTGADAAGARSQVRSAKLSRNGTQLIPATNAAIASGSDPSFLLINPFSLSSIGFGTYGFDFYYAQDWCCWVDNSGKKWPWGQSLRQVDNVTYPPPSISSTAPSYALPGATLDLTINGSGLGIADAGVNLYRGITSININGNGCPSTCGITATVRPVPVDDVGSEGPPPAASSAEASITVSPAAQSGTYQISVTAFGVESNRVNFMVGDSTPVINYITQQTLQPGEQGSISIYGSNFGAGCSNVACTGASISVCRSGDSSCGSSDVVPAVTFWSDTQIDAALSAGPEASGSYDVQVTSAGAAGLGFTPTPAQVTGSHSNRKSIAVNGNPNVSLHVTSNGSTLNALNCANITGVPAMPQIAASIAGNNNIPVTGTATWQIKTTFPHKKRDTNTGNVWWETDSNSTPASPVSLAATQAWQPAFQSIFGGHATLNWTYNGQQQQPFNFYICGTNPDYGTVGGVLDAMPYWFARKIAIHETNMSQFCESGRMDVSYCAASNDHFGWPVLGPPAGYGMMQLDPAATVDLLWNWRTNADGGKTRLDQLAGPQQDTFPLDGRAYPFWIRQVREWNLYNSLRSPAERIAPPPDRQETSSCTFTLPLNKPWDSSKDSVGLETPTSGANSTYWFADAVLIKQYHGAKFAYMSWKNKRLGPGELPSWSYTPGNNVSSNTVKEVCSCTGPPRDCLRLH